MIELLLAVVFLPRAGQPEFDWPVETTTRNMKSQFRWVKGTQAYECFFLLFWFFNFLIFQVSTMLVRNCSNQTARLASKIRQKLQHVNLQNISLYWAIQNINRLNDRKAYTELMIYFERWTWICTQASIQLIC